MSDVFRRFPPGLALIHPWLLASYVVLAPAAANLLEVGPTAGLRAWIVVLLAATLSWLLLRAFLRNGAKAALLTSVAILLFFSYGHAYSYLDTHPFWGLSLGRHRFLAPLSFLALLVAVWFVQRSRKLGTLQLAFTLSSAVLIIFPLAQSAGVLWSNREARPGNPALHNEACSLRLPSGAPAPDVYYIILDAYSRQDELLRVHEFDNSEFIGQLESMGFYVADGSQSNYGFTQLSLASSLNLDYVQSLGSYTPAGDADPDPQILIQQSRLAHELQCLGYVIVGFETGHIWSEWRDADFFLTRKTNVFDRLSLTEGLSEFEGMLLQTTAARVLKDTGVLKRAAEILPRFTSSRSADEFAGRRARDWFVLRSLGKMETLPSPKLVFVHLLLPHPPFIFHPDGQPRVPDDSDRNFLGMTTSPAEGYVEQMIFLNRQIVPALQQIIDQSDTPPIIVLQGDHGYSKRTPAERLQILNAYLLPGQGGQALYPTITPVNTFRLILDSYFGGNYPLLPDVSYWDADKDRYDFKLIENIWGGEGEAVSP